MTECCHSIADLVFPSTFQNMKTETQNPIPLPVVLSGYKTWTLALRAEGIDEDDREKDI